MSRMYDAIIKKQALANELRAKGFAYSNANNLEAAIELHKKAKEINEELGDIGAAAGDVTNMAIAYEELGELAKAEELHLEAAKMDESISYKQGLRIDYSNLSRFYASQGNFQDALSWQMKLITVNLALGDITGTAVNYRDRGFILAHLTRIEEAIQCHQEARRLNQISQNQIGETNNIVDIANLHEKLDQKDKALELYLEATKYNEKIGNFEGLRITYKHLARIYAEQGDLIEAQKYQVKLSIVISKTLEIPELNAFLIDASGIKSGISIVKRQEDTYDVGYDIPFPVRRSSRWYPVVINDKRLENIGISITSITEQVNKAKEIRGKLPVKEDSDQLKAVKAQIMNDLKNLGKALYAITLPSPIKRIFKQLQKTDAIEIGVGEYLVSYPWELMHDDTDFICLSSNLGRYVVFDNGGDEIPSIRRKTREKLRILIVGDPSRDEPPYYLPPFEHLQNLPGARKEANELARLLSNVKGVEVKLLCGKEINTVSLLSELSSNYDFIHYTGHAIFAQADPMESGLVLHDGIVRAYEIIQSIDSEQPPLLAFVNACESSQETNWGYEIKYENQVFGLASAFLQHGTNYVGSLWPLHDDPAVEIAIDFYKSIFEGRTFGEALRRARKKSYDKYGQEEIAWASYILYGDPSILVRSTQRNVAELDDFVKDILAQRLFGLDR